MVWFVLDIPCVSFNAFFYFFSYAEALCTFHKSYLYLLVDFFTFVAVQCYAVGFVENAEYTVSCYHYSCSITYQCASGYVHMHGQLTRTCTAEGYWSGIPPICQGKWVVCHKKPYLVSLLLSYQEEDVTCPSIFGKVPAKSNSKASFVPKEGWKGYQKSN